MAINNVYGKTPKRIFTNKPFVNGMVYTNADLSPNVCRAVANLDMEASNTATRVRQSVHNLAVSEDDASNIAFKFFNRLVIFDSYISEDLYNADLIINMPDNSNILPDGKLGLTIKTETSNEPEAIMPKIIYNDAVLEWVDGSLNLTNASRFLSAISNSTHIYPLRLDTGVYPHCINSNDYSFSFFGIITNGITELYKGLIKLYYHVTAQQIIIEVISPYVVDPMDVSNYGANIVSSNPLVYKDYIYYNSVDNNYTDYIGGQNEELGIIDISTVQIYDQPVSPNQYDNVSTANIVKGVSKDASEEIYVRPYVALPKGNYYASVTAKASVNNQAVDMRYNFNQNTFSKVNTLDAQVMYPGNPVTFNYSSRDRYIQEGNLETIKDYLEQHMYYAKTGSFLDNGEIHINIPEMNFRSVPNNESYGRYVKQNNICNIIESAGHGYTTENMFVYNNLLLTSLYMDVKEQELKIPVNEISTSSSNPTKIPIVFSATENLQVYMGIASDSDAFIGVSQTDQILLRVVLHKSDFSNGSVNSIIRRVTWGGIEKSDITSVVLVDTYAEDYGGVDFNYDIIENEDSSITIASNITIGTIPSSSKDRGLTLYIRGNKNTNVLYESEKAVYTGLEMYYSIYRDGDSFVSYPVIKTDLSKFYTRDKDTAAYTEHLSSPISFFTQLHNSAGEGATTPEIDELVEASYKWESLYDFRNKYVKNYRGDTIISRLIRNFKINIIGLTHSLINESLSIGTDYIQQIQFLDESTGNINNNYNLKIDTDAFTNKYFNNEAAVVLEVKIISGDIQDDALYYSANNSVSKTSAPLQINLTSMSKLYYNELDKNYDLKNRPNNIAMHLGHYVYYNSNAEDNSLFYSYYNDPSYFPSMYVITLDNPIVHVHPHQSSLVVFTTNDIYLIYNGNVPSTTTTDGAEIAFTVKLIQSNVRLGSENYNTVRSIGKDVFFISDSNNGYLLKTNKYVTDASDTYLIKVTTAIDSLLEDPYEYATSRYTDYKKPIANTHYKLIFQDPVSMSLPDNIDLNLYTKFSYTTEVYDSLEVIDGDTIRIENTVYRLAGINTPESTGVVERLGILAKEYLVSLVDKGKTESLTISLYVPKNSSGDYVTTYGRYVAYLFIGDYLVNAELLKGGVAKLAFGDYSSGLLTTVSNISQLTNVTLHKYMTYCASIAKYYNLGVYNNLEYTELGLGDSFKIMPTSKINQKYVYATNSYIYIINSIGITPSARFTIIYKYNLDNRTWTSYDFIGAVFPVEHNSDYSKTGFKLYCSNSHNNISNKASVLSFKEGYLDYSNVTLNEDYNMCYIASGETLPINAYFDSGNQSISLMNDKLFREVKLFLGSAPDNILDIDYNIRLYLDGKEVQPNTHYKGKQENDQGFKKITFFTPGRGRIPRVTFHINCESDLNILQYALVYLQLNAK